MNKPLPIKKLAQPKPDDLYEDGPRSAPVASEPPRMVTFSSYLLPGTLTRLYRWAYQNRMSVQDALNELLDAMLISDPNADKPMSDKAEAKLQEKLLKPKKNG